MLRSDKQIRLPAESGASACLRPSDRQAQAGMSILVIDDDPEIRSSVGDVSAGAGAHESTRPRTGWWA